MAFTVPSAFYVPSGGAYTVPSANPYTDGEFVNPSPLLPPVGPISGVSVTNITTTGFQVSLNAVSRATNYAFQWGTYLENETTPNGIFSGLPPDTTNDLTINAYNEDGNVYSSPTAVSTLLPPPPPPGGLTAQNITTTTFQLDWIPAPYTSSYTAKWGAIAGDVSGTTALFSNLPPATTSNCIVTASNSSGSTQSGPYPVLTGLPAPTAPTGVSANTILANGFNATWNAVPYTSSYTALWGSYPGSVTGTSAFFTGLPVDTSNNLVVTAINPMGSASSSPISVRTAVPPPSAPSGLVASSITSNSFDVSWNAVPYASSYTALWDSYSGSVSNTTASFTSLPSITTNNVVVTASNASGTASSLPLSVTTSNSVPPPPAPSNIQSYRRGTNYITFNWTPAGGSPPILYSATLDGSPISVVSNVAYATGLSNATEYTLVVTASNAGGTTSAPPFVSATLDRVQFLGTTGGVPWNILPAEGFNSQLIGHFDIPADYDVTNNTTLETETNQVYLDKWFEYIPFATPGAFMALRLSKVEDVNNFENEWVAYLPESGTGSEFGSSNRPNPPSWGSSNAWTFAPGDTYSMYFLIPYPGWVVIDGQVNELSFGYNPFTSNQYVPP